MSTWRPTGCGDGRQIAFVRADDEVAAPQGTVDHAGLDDVGDVGAAGQGSGGPGPGVVESSGVAPGQEPGELRLAGVPRQHWAITAAGTVGTTRRSSRARWRAHIRRPPRSAAISAPES